MIYIYGFFILNDGLCVLMLYYNHAVCRVIQVPLHYKLMGYQAVSAWETFNSYIPTSLARPLRTGAPVTRQPSLWFLFSIYSTCVQLICPCIHTDSFLLVLSCFRTSWCPAELSLPGQRRPQQEQHRSTTRTWKHRKLLVSPSMHLKICSDLFQQTHSASL